MSSPFDGTVVGTAAVGGKAELFAAIEAANQAYVSWREEPRFVRQRVLRQISAAVQCRADDLANLLVEEIGKPISWARAEVARLALTFQFAADQLMNWGVESVPTDVDPRGSGYRCMVERFPLGVVFCLAPYNWPFNLSAHKIAPALAVGNTVVLKASPLAPLCTMELARLILEAGAPAGLVNVWNGPDEFVAGALHDPRVKMLSFTGSAKVGWMLKGLMNERPVVLELGGDAFAIVCEDADLSWASQRISAGAFGYAGQVCISVQHVLAHEDVYGRFRDAMVEAARACPTGDPRLEDTVCGPVINRSAADRICRMVDEAVALGATPLVRGEVRGNVIFPTLLENVPETAELMREEVFGPVVTLNSYRGLDQAIDQVNRSNFGIQAGVFTSDIHRIDRCFREIDTGGVVVNDYPTLRFDHVPYGGEKQSGFGREGVRSSMDEMSRTKSLVINHNGTVS